MILKKFEHLNSNHFMHSSLEKRYKKQQLYPAHQGAPQYQSEPYYGHEHHNYQQNYYMSNYGQMQPYQGYSNDDHDDIHPNYYPYSNQTYEQLYKKKMMEQNQIIQSNLQHQHYPNVGNYSKNHQFQPLLPVDELIKNLKRCNKPGASIIYEFGAKFKKNIQFDFKQNQEESNLFTCTLYIDELVFGIEKGQGKKQAKEIVCWEVIDHIAKQDPQFQQYFQKLYEKQSASGQISNSPSKKSKIQSNYNSIKQNHQNHIQQDDDLIYQNNNHIDIQNTIQQNQQPFQQIQDLIQQNDENIQQNEEEEEVQIMQDGNIIKKENNVKIEKKEEFNDDEQLQQNLVQNLLQSSHSEFGFKDSNQKDNKIDNFPTFYQETVNYREILAQKAQQMFKQNFKMDIQQINDQYYATVTLMDLVAQGTGKIKKNAKNHACYKMLEIINSEIIEEREDIIKMGNEMKSKEQMRKKENLKKFKDKLKKVKQANLLNKTEYVNESLFELSQDMKESNKQIEEILIAFENNISASDQDYEEIDNIMKSLMSFHEVLTSLNIVAVMPYGSYVLKTLTKDNLTLDVSVNIKIQQLQETEENKEIDILKYNFDKISQDFYEIFSRIMNKETHVQRIEVDYENHKIFMKTKDFDKKHQICLHFTELDNFYVDHLHHYIYLQQYLDPKQNKQQRAYKPTNDKCRLISLGLKAISFFHKHFQLKIPVQILEYIWINQKYWLLYDGLGQPIREFFQTLKTWDGNRQNWQKLWKDNYKFESEQVKEVNKNANFILDGGWEIVFGQIEKEQKSDIQLQPI